MARTWTVTGPPKTVLSDGAGEASFTITNLIASPVRGLIRLLPEGEAKPEMFKLAGEATQDWAPNETKQVTVQISAQGAPVGTYVYSTAVVSESNPSELADRISSSFEVPEPPPPPKFPIGILLGVLGVLVIGGGILAFFLLRGGVEVPEVEGLTIGEAETALTEAGFVVAAEPVENDDVPNGVVVGSDPPQGDDADEGTTVTLSVSTGPPIPDVLAAGAGARQTLESAGFTVVVTEEFSDVPAGQVVATDPPPGARAAPGQAVNVVLSQGPETPASVAVPNVIGESLAGATAILNQAGLGVFSQCQWVDFGPQGVINQIPSAGSAVAPGSDVSIIVAQPFCLILDFDTVMINELGSVLSTPGP